jgi:hypothetical protein
LPAHRESHTVNLASVLVDYPLKTPGISECPILARHGPHRTGRWADKSLQ